MLKNASINTRVDAGLKSQAESVLNELGMSMATAMTLYLKQIVLHQGIPFDVCLPQRKPISYETQSDTTFNDLMDQAAHSYFEGSTVSLGGFEKEMAKKMKE